MPGRNAPTGRRFPSGRDHAAAAFCPIVAPAVPDSSLTTLPPGSSVQPPVGPASREGAVMAREGYRIFDADTHIIEPVEPVEAYLSRADQARLAALGPLVQRSPGKGG